MSYETNAIFLNTSLSHRHYSPKAPVEDSHVLKGNVTLSNDGLAIFPVLSLKILIVFPVTFQNSYGEGGKC